MVSLAIRGTLSPLPPSLTQVFRIGSNFMTLYIIDLNGFTSISWRLFDDLRFNRIMHLGASPPSHPTRYLSRRVLTFMLTFPSLIWVHRTQFKFFETTEAAGEIEEKYLFYIAVINDNNLWNKYKPSDSAARFLLSYRPRSARSVLSPLLANFVSS